jgi:hypothetical protein
MNGYDAYRIYVSLKAHFRGDRYDFFKYGRIAPKVQTFENRKDRHFFDKLAKKYSTDETMVQFLVSQMQENPNTWVGSMIGEEANQRYLEWRRRNERLTYQFGEDIKTLVRYSSLHEKFTPNAWSRLFIVENGNHPKILKLLMQKKITPETFCILDQMLSFTESWNLKMENDPIWQEMSGRIRGYRTFVSNAANIQSLKESIRKILCEST